MALSLPCGIRFSLTLQGRHLSLLIAKMRISYFSLFHRAVRITDHPALWSSDFPPLIPPDQTGWDAERPSVLLRPSSFPEISGKLKKSLQSFLGIPACRQACLRLPAGRQVRNQESLSYFFSSLPFSLAIFLWIASLAKRSASRLSSRGMDSISKEAKALRFSITSL